jgi:hypothetical protein
MPPARGAQPIPECRNLADIHQLRTQHGVSEEFNALNMGDAHSNDSDGQTHNGPADVLS